MASGAAKPDVPSRPSQARAIGPKASLSLGTQNGQANKEAADGRPLSYSPTEVMKEAEEAFAAACRARQQVFKEQLMAEQEVLTLRALVEEERGVQQREMQAELVAHRARLTEETEAAMQQARSNLLESDRHLRNSKKVEAEAQKSRAAVKRLEERALQAIEATLQKPGNTHPPPKG